jgi:hypothetical protein
MYLSPFAQSIMLCYRYQGFKSQAGFGDGFLNDWLSTRWLLGWKLTTL